MSAMDVPAQLSVERRDGVVWLGLARPEKRNALSTTLIESMTSALRAADADPSAIAAVITGTGGVFCAGVDLAEFPAGSPPAAAARRLVALAQLLETVGAIGIPVLAALNGAAVGAGAALALACDGVLMADHATLSFPELKRGIAPYLVAPLLVRCVGRSAAFELLSRATPVAASTALQRGWVNAVVPAEDLQREAGAWARQLAACPRAQMAHLKQLLRAPSEAALPEALAHAVALYSSPG